MTADQLAKQFERWVAALDAPLGSLTPRDGLDLIVRLFEAAPSLSELTCAWRVPLKICPVEFQLCITLWTSLAIESPTSHCVRTQSLAFKIDSGLARDYHPSWMEWVNDPLGASDFRAAVQNRSLFAQVADAAPLGAGWLDDVQNWWTAPFRSPDDATPGAKPPRFNKAQWQESTDVPRMLRWFCQQWTGDPADLARLLARYYLACCRRIWPLLPQPESRAAVEVGEQVLDGRVTPKHYLDAERAAEGAAINLQFGCEPESVARWCRVVANIPDHEMRALLHQPRSGGLLIPRGLLNDAASFADDALCTAHAARDGAKVSVDDRHSIVNRYAIFLSAPLLREMVGNPFR